MHNIFGWFKNKLINTNTRRSTFLLILGAQKAGTTTLFQLLNTVPGFCGASKKEVGYFSNDSFYENGRSWYLTLFNKYEEDDIRFEATPEYLYYPYVPERISKFGLPVRFIVLLREPAARCYSAWNMFRTFNKNSAQRIFDNFIKHANKPNIDVLSDLLFTGSFPSFRQAMFDDIERYMSGNINIEPSFVRRGIYCEQIKNYLKYFQLADFLFIEQRELGCPKSVLEKISNFLDMEIDMSLIYPPVVSNAREYENNDEDVQQILKVLKSFYHPFNKRLFDQIGVYYDWNE